MKPFNFKGIEKSPRIQSLIDNLFLKMPEIEPERAVLLTESYKMTEHEPIIMRRAKAFSHIVRNLPVTIRDEELIVGSATKSSRSCQIFPEYSFSWIEDEFDTIETRSADPFKLSDETKAQLKGVFDYFRGKTTSEFASFCMEDETKKAMEHNIFTPGNYYYNGVGHISVDYGKVLKIGYKGIMEEAKEALSKLSMTDADFIERSNFLRAVIISCEGAIAFAKRYSELAFEMASKCSDEVRKKELLTIGENCSKVPENGATSFYEACQSFWFVQLLIQTEASGHSISPGRFDQYMYPYFKKDYEEGKITLEFAQELIDCVWVKLNDFTKVRDEASAEGFAGYSLFQNLIAGGQTKDGRDATNLLSFMCIEATMHVMLPQPSFSVRVWNGTPHEFMVKASELTRTGVGLPAYYNDEVIIPALVSRGVSLEDARNYCIIGCVEPQSPGKTDGWHDAAFFNMCRVMELVFENGRDNGELISIETGDVAQMKTFEEFFDAYKKQMEYQISLMVNADNAIDVAHLKRCPLPYLSSMVDDCISKGKSVQEGGAKYNFTGPQGFGIANMADAFYAVKKLVFEDKKITLCELREALRNNFGQGTTSQSDEKDVIAKAIVKQLVGNNSNVSEAEIERVYNSVVSQKGGSNSSNNARYQEILKMIDELPKFGNDIDEVDILAREAAYTYTRPVEKYKNPRGGQFQAGLYPVSANVPLGAQTGATPDGRLAYTPVADGVSPCSGKDVSGPTAAANSVSKLDHFIASNGTLYNMKFHPSALKGSEGINNFVSLIRAYFDQKGSHMQFNVVSRDTLLDAQKHPENYKSLVVRVAGYSALFTTLSKSLQDDIIKRTEQSSF